MQKWTIAFCAASYVAALMALAPASLLDGRLQEESHGVLHLSSAEGTLWNGRGFIDVDFGESSEPLSQPIRWRVVDASWMPLMLSFQVLSAPNSSSLVMMTTSGIELRNLVLDLPASVFGALAPGVDAMKLSGRLALRAEHIIVIERAISGNATVNWSDARTQLSPLSPAGEFLIELEFVASMIRANVTTLRGPLEINGRGTWTPGQPRPFNADFTIQGDARQQLAPMLSLVAIEHAKGSYSLALP